MKRAPQGFERKCPDSRIENKWPSLGPPPLSSILNSLSNILQAVFETGSQVSESISSRLSGASCSTRNGITQAAGCGTSNTTHSAHDSADSVSEGGRNELSGTGDALVLRGGGVGVKRHCGGLFVVVSKCFLKVRSRSR
ncbi:hypothetical protein BJY04DRAFT_201061 [Aspergillus karnatakaensis]|uniref:uncharacterized protein n=1 Tax=Aspergillus karnatakaensis TaxID=1810916 RepID=UPI003CCDCB49